jgi:hypothetical protein
MPRYVDNPFKGSQRGKADATNNAQSISALENDESGKASPGRQNGGNYDRKQYAEDLEEVGDDNDLGMYGYRPNDAVGV